MYRLELFFPPVGEEMPRTEGKPGSTVLYSGSGGGAEEGGVGESSGSDEGKATGEQKGSSQKET
jgi:hypothetical protein